LFLYLLSETKIYLKFIVSRLWLFINP
jgi:hypothetical protein